MQSIAEVINKLGNTMMGLTSETCDKHTVNANGRILEREIQMISHDGEVFCPLCERERSTKELSEAEDAKIKRFMAGQKYKTFENRSVLTDKGLLDSSFGNYETLEKEEIDNKDRAVAAFKRYKEGEVFNTWLTGIPGVGKSHLAMSILRNLNESGDKDKSCLFVSVDEMLMRIRDSFNNKESRYTESYFVDLLSGVDYLVLDDLGAETGGTGTRKTATDFTLRILYAVANGRQDKSTIVTSNLSRTALESMYDPKFVSRLMKNTHLINFKETKDKRIRNIDF